MISWMQKHNKYLVWTIWVATIAFIGAGFVGWGSYNFGSKAGNVAKVGEIEIPQAKLNLVYSSIYNQYNEALQGQLDEKKAQEMGLVQQAFKRLETQARMLNFAQEIGIIVTDEEVARRIHNMPAFQKDGRFDKEIYMAYLKAQRLKAKSFEATLRDELIIQKTIKLLSVEALPLETEAISAAINVSDKLAYQVLTKDDVNIHPKEEEIKAFWEMQKENFMTKQLYDLSIVWTHSLDTNVSEEELKSYYEANSFNYTNAQGKQLSFEEAKTQVTRDLKLKKTKKSAQKAYIAFKKGELTQSEKITLPIGDLKLTPAIWESIKQKSVGDIIKPKVIGDMYATIKIEKITKPRLKKYSEAKDDVTRLYLNQAKQEALLRLAEERLASFDINRSIVSDFVKMEKNVNLQPLNNQESLQFLQKLFTSTKEKGIISVADKIVVYNVLEQKLAPTDANEAEAVNQTVNQLKRNTFESNLIKTLGSQYPTETYVGGLTN